MIQMKEMSLWNLSSLKFHPSKTIYVDTTQ